MLDKGRVAGPLARGHAYSSYPDRSRLSTYIYFELRKGAPRGHLANSDALMSVTIASIFGVLEMTCKHEIKQAEHRSQPIFIHGTSTKRASISGECL